MGPGQDTHQRRLAGAVAAHQGDDLAGMQVDADAVDGVDATEGHADVAHLDEGNRAPVARRRSARHRLAHARHRVTPQPVRLRSAASRPTATIRTIPTTMSCVGES